MADGGAGSGRRARAARSHTGFEKRAFNNNPTRVPSHCRHRHKTRREREVKRTQRKCLRKEKRVGTSQTSPPPPPLRADRSAGGKATPRPTSVASASGAAAPIATLNVQMLQTGSYSPDEGLAVLGEAALRPAFSSSCLAPIMAALTLSSHVANGLKCGSLTTAIASCSLRNLSYDPGRSVPKRGHGRTTQGQRRGVHRRRNLG